MKTDTRSSLTDVQIKAAELEIQAAEYERELACGLKILRTVSPEAAEQFERVEAEPLTRPLEEAILDPLRALGDTDVLQFALDMLSKLLDLKDLRAKRRNLAFT